MKTGTAWPTGRTDRLSSAHRSSGSDRAERVSLTLYIAGLVLSSSVGLLHFFAPYAFAWYSYIPDAPLEIHISIDYVNFLFSLLLTGLSLILLCLARRAFEGSVEAVIFYTFLALVWLSRVFVALVLPWPTSLHTWLLVGALTFLGIMLIPAVYLWGIVLRTPRST